MMQARLPAKLSSLLSLRVSAGVLIALSLIQTGWADFDTPFTVPGTVPVATPRKKPSTRKGRLVHPTPVSSIPVYTAIPASSGAPGYSTLPVQNGQPPSLPAYSGTSQEDPGIYSTVNPVPGRGWAEFSSPTTRLPAINSLNAPSNPPRFGGTRSHQTTQAANTQAFPMGASGAGASLGGFKPISLTPGAMPSGQMPDDSMNNGVNTGSGYPGNDAMNGSQGMGGSQMMGNFNSMPTGMPITRRNLPQDGSPVQLTSPQPTRRETMPINPSLASSSPLSIDNPDNSQDYMRYTPYNTYTRDIDLWNIEGSRFVRSPVVLSPDKSRFVYSEVLFVPYNRQTLSRLYIVQTPPMPALPMEHLPSEDALRPTPMASYQSFTDRFNPDKSLQNRRLVVEVGYNKVTAFGFKTLTVVDWSASGQKVLIKEKSGTLHVGLRTSDVLVYDTQRGSASVYPELRRAIENYWKTKGNRPDINQNSWEMTPLGWEPGSDDAIMVKAWAVDPQNKLFMGLWRYNVTAERTELVSLQDSMAAVAANGFTAMAGAPRPTVALKQTWWQKVTFQPPTPAPGQPSVSRIPQYQSQQSYRGRSISPAGYFGMNGEVQTQTNRPAPYGSQQPSNGGGYSPSQR